ncbi:NAD(P)/FAD-dependent oxidoreductase [Rubeoparvulum massiliense]|uniref:NAD(P)/FAD-dependent oxidoreductase n=1 Tax=Rubeoparvulum massiliense TaxID=1631346 RepID=UPI00065E6D9E|nr:NAD(P)/FAD-dependent oxidoreductase [Rubeoparvulum massiliense]
MKKRMVILGGGYAGMRLLQRLLPTLPSDREVILIDRLPYHTFKVEYYALAAGTEPAASLTYPFPDHPSLSKIYGEVQAIDPEEKVVLVREAGTIPYDELVIAVGCVDHYQGIPGAEEHALSIQTIKKAQHASQKLTTLDPYEKVAIIGGGLSGVELAAELRESRADLNITIINRGDGVLSPFPQKLRNYVSKWFIENDVQLLNHQSVTRVGADHLQVENGEELSCDAIVWSAGIRPSHVVDDIPGERDRNARILVKEDYSHPQYPDLYVIGDCASAEFAPSAYLAEKMADRLVMVLQAKWKGETVELPRLKLSAMFGSLGKKQGFAVIGDTPLLGRVPRILKSGVLWIYKYHLG